MKTYWVTELLGDGIGTELSASVHALAEALPVNIEFLAVDLGVENRAKIGRGIYSMAHESMKETAATLKHPTVTEHESPNAILRRMCNFTVIHRPVTTIPWVKSNFKEEIDLDIIRVATGGTYDDPGRLVGRDGAVSIRIIEREPCRQAAVYAFELARKLKKSVTSASKYTIQRATDGLFEEVVKEVEVDYSDVIHKVELFDSLLAKIIMQPKEFEVVLVLNEYGDFLSDMACGLVGSVGIGASASYAFDESAKVTLAMFDQAGGTAPDIAGKGIADPTGILLAFALMLVHLGEVELSEAIKTAILQLLTQGISTPDLGGSLTTMEFTARVTAQVGKLLA
ncbi:MAG: isocitrate dehydrogenase [Candidatus Latescibacteria bacterium]|nr:isocitrate dehydrogenase [Candidatus Latescibacterota bacterium]